MNGATEAAAQRPQPADDPFARVAELPGVEEAVADARKAVDRLLGHRILRRRSAEVSTESALRAARASAALEGAEVSLDDLRGEAAAAGAPAPAVGEVAAVGEPAAGAGPAVRAPAVQGALRVSAELGALSDTWRLAPRQALARLHVLAAADAVGPAVLGRPRAGGDGAAASVTGGEDGGGMVADPLRLGPPPAADEMAARLDALCSLLVRPTKAPALVVGALVHGELLALRPFGWGDGIVARAAERLTFVERGLDPKSLTAPEVGHAELAAGYTEALRGYAAGTPEGVAGWIRHCADATVAAARDSLAICEAFMRG